MPHNDIDDPSRDEDEFAQLLAFHGFLHAGFGQGFFFGLFLAAFAQSHTSLTLFQAGLEWALRRPGFLKLPILLWSAPFGLASGGGFMGVPATTFEKYRMSTNRNLAWARHYERQATIS